MAIEGNLQELELAEIVQLNCRSKNMAHVIVEANQEQGNIYFDKGQVVHAEYADQTGVDAFYEMLHWNDGRFIMETGVAPPRVTINTTWQNLLLTGLKTLDEKRLATSTNTNRKEVKADVKANVKTVKLLQKLVEIVDGARTAHIVGPEGQLIATTKSGMAEDQTLAYVVNQMNLMQKTTHLLAAGPIQEFLAFQEDKQIIAKFLPDTAFAICLTLEATSSIGAARLYLADVVATLTNQFEH